MVLEYIRELLTYQEWADCEFFKRWRELERAGEDQAIKKLTDHFTTVQTFFLYALQKQQSDLPDRNAPPRSVPELLAGNRQNHLQLKNYVSSLTEESLSLTLDVPWFPGNFRPTVSEILMQIIMHTQHHRAQVLQSLAAYGEKSIIIDWISWVFRGKPVANWEFERGIK